MRGELKVTTTKIYYIHIWKWQRIFFKGEKFHPSMAYKDTPLSCSPQSSALQSALFFQAHSSLPWSDRVHSCSELGANKGGPRYLEYWDLHGLAALSFKVQLKSLYTNLKQPFSHTLTVSEFSLCSAPAWPIIFPFIYVHLFLPLIFNFTRAGTWHTSLSCMYLKGLNPRPLSEYSRYSTRICTVNVGYCYFLSLLLAGGSFMANVKE